jgi:hypothetical protein
METTSHECEPKQPALFEMVEDHRPAAEQTTEGRYLQPALFYWK